MSSVIVLSDSDEFASPVEKHYKNGYNNETKRRYDYDVTSDVDLPEMPIFRRAEDSASQSDENLFGLNVNDGTKRVYCRSPHAMSDSADSEDNRAEKALRKITASKKSKTTLKEERLKRQQALAREKALRAIALKKSRDMKPGECIKFMEIDVDKGIDAFSFCMDIQSVLRDANVQCNVTPKSIPNSITWRRNVEESYVDENNKVCMRKNMQTERYIILIWNNHEAVKHIANGTLCTSLSEYKALILDYNMTLVIFGMEEYFTYHKVKEKSSQSFRGKGSKSKSKGNEQFENLPIISRQQLELDLTEAQIVINCSSRLIESAQDLALMIYQYTKSISEIPYKLQKKSVENKFEWYVVGDNRNTVRVDKDGNGLKRLWQQQLCQFNLCSLETAEAICTVYSSPVQLIEAYKNCTPEEGINLLKDIPIRRAAGPLTSVRKVGPRLSKKIYVMFTSQNGDALLTED